MQNTKTTHNVSPFLSPLTGVIHHTSCSLVAPYVDCPAIVNIEAVVCSVWARIALSNSC